MESLKTSEALEKGSVMLKHGPPQNPCDKTLEEASRSSELFDSSDLCADSVSASGLSLTKDGVVTDVNSTDRELGNVQVGHKECGTSQLHGDKTEVSGDGISLFVDVFGSFDETRGEMKYFGESKIVQGNLCQGNVHSPVGNSEDEKVSAFDDCGRVNDGMTNDAIDTEVKGGNEVSGETLESEKYKYFVGDLIWVKTKVQSWWPGLICDPLSASKNALDSDKRGYLFVKYFGNGNFIWCSPSQLKPFITYFELLSKQGCSRSFRSAVRRALGEFGSRVKMEMTCSCVPKESLSAHANLADGRRKGESVSKGGIGEVVEFLSNQFEPVSFLAFIKNLASVDTIPGMIELTIIQGRLSAFGHYEGHLQLPIHLLRPTSESKDSVREELTSEKSRDLNELSRQGRDIVQQKSECDGSDARIMSGGFASVSQKPDRDCSDEAEDLDCHSLTSSRVKMVTPLVSLETLEIDRDGYESTKKNYEIGCRLRERKRSKYLSPPYVNLKKGQESTTVSGEQQATENLTTNSHVGVDIDKTAQQTVGSVIVAKCSGKKSHKKLSRKLSTGHKNSGRVEALNLSSSEILSELHFTALDCLHPSESKYFESIESFLSEFRKIVFHEELNHGMVSVHTVDQKEPDHDMHLHPTVPVEVQTKKGLETEKETPGHERIKVTSVTSDMNKIANHTCAAVKDWHAINTDVSHVVCWREAKKEESASLAMKTNPNAYLSDVNKNHGGSGPMIINFEMGTAATKGEAVVKSKKNARVNLELKNTESVTGLPDLNVNDSGLLIESMQGKIPRATRGKLVPRKKKRKGGAFSEDLESVTGLLGVNKINFGSQLNNVQTGGMYPVQKNPELTNSEGVDKTASLFLNSPCTSKQPNDHSNILNSSFLIGGSFRAGPADKLRRRRQKEKISDSVAPAIPDLNDNPTKCISADKVKHQRKRRKKHESAPGMPPVMQTNGVRKRRKKRESAPGMPPVMQTSGVSVATALLLKFSQEYPLPSKESLAATFCSFGPLKVSEINISNDGNAQVVFVRNSDAGNALQSLEQSSPFGPGLVSYRLQNVLAVSKSPPVQPLNGFRTPPKVSGLKPNQNERPDLSYIRRNLEMMTSMLEKSGDNLSPEMRTKLESEIQGLMSKVSTVVGSSTSGVHM